MTGTGSRDCPIQILEDVDMTASPEISMISRGSKKIPETLTCRKRPRSDMDVQDGVQFLLRDASVVDSVKADEMVVDSQISPKAVRNAWNTLSQSKAGVSIKGRQPSCLIRADSLERVPICKDSGRKRSCASIRA